MKNNIYKTIGLLAIFLVTLNTIAQQDRNVVWVHGLDGSADSWQHYNDIFDDERQINSLRRSYDTDHGVDFTANRVIASMSAFGREATDPRNLAIGHSMGGVVIRDVDRLTSVSNKNFGGLITVTAPNYGAPISNSLIDGDVESAALDACGKISAGPEAELFNLPWIVIGLLTTEDICGFFITNKKIQEYQGTPTTNYDLRVGSTTINAINNYPTNIPRISIWAEENSPVHWRLFSSDKNGNDTDLKSTISTARDVYNVFYINNIARSITYIFINPFAAVRYSRVAKQWKKGRDWIDDSETIWSSLIKTTRTEPQTYWEEVWVPCPYPPKYQEIPAANPEGIASKSVDPDCGEWVWQELTRYVTVNYPSDGFLPQYTQIMLDNPTPDNTYHIVGANHVEVRNMSNSTLNGQPNDATRARFNEIFNRPEDDFFYTSH